jgi:hypothetical protein
MKKGSVGDEDVKKQVKYLEEGGGNGCTDRSSQRGRYGPFC